MISRHYKILNYVFAGMILAIFFYSVLFSPTEKNYPIKCIHKELLGAPCPSCGLSRGFSAIMHFNLSMANQIQPNSLAIFSFFLIQLWLRISFIFLTNWQKIPLKTLTSIDIALSTLLFFWFFRHLILQTLYIFYKMLLTGNVG
jgi:hypothetical protein